MPKIEFKISYKKNTGLLISPTELKVLYLYGIEVRSTDGTKFNDSVIEMHIRQAQAEIEKLLSIKLIKQLITETQSYYKDDYLVRYPVITTNFPVIKPYACLGVIGTVEQVIFPETWLSSRKGVDISYSRRINIVPTGSVTATIAGGMILSGVMHQVGLMSQYNVPDYFTIQYTTGFEKIEYDLFNLVGMTSALQTLIQAGDFVLGPGISSTSLGIDGLSQSISSVNSAQGSAFAARIKEYRATIENTLKNIKSRYTGIRFTTM